MISGYYKDIDDNIITVTFSGANVGEYTISEDSSIRFAYEPVTISENIDDVFDEIITQTADIDLVVDDYIGDNLFAKSPREIECTITKQYGNDNPIVLFNGYVVPAAFSQPHNKPHEHFSIQAVDKLATLQYYYYKTTNTLADYERNLGSAGMVSFSSLLDGILGTDNWRYQGTKVISLNNVYISEAEIYGESFDDIMTQEDILIHICRFLSCHAKYDSTTGKIILFSWVNVKSSSGSYVITGAGENENIRRSDMDITIDDVYSQIQVKDNVTPVEEIVNSPLASDTLSSPYSSSQHWMTEYIADGDGEFAWGCIRKMMGYDDGQIDRNHDKYNDVKPHRKEWYFQINQSKYWDLYDTNNNNINYLMTGINQTDLLEKMRNSNYTPLFISVGSTEDLEDTSSYTPSPLKKPNLTNYLVISVNGDFTNKKVDSELDSLPSEGIMRYNGFSAANLTPADDTSTNYIIISGKITLAPIVTQSGTPSVSTSIYSYNTNGTVASTTSKVLRTDNYTFNGVNKPTGTEEVKSYAVPSDNNGNGRYYWRRFFKQTYPSKLIDNVDHIPADSSLMLYPMCDVKKIIEEDPYAASAQGVANSKYNAQSAFVYDRTTTDRTQTGNDEINKLPILACKLSVGDVESGNIKYLVETYDGVGNSVYSWSSTEGYFTIGIDPKMGDRIIGQEFSIQDNTNNYGIDASGMAIPITDEVPVSGRVNFSILGPVNIVYNDYIRKHPTAWRHTSYIETGNINLLSYISNIWISDFSVKIYTDNGYADNKGDSDIYYISDVDENSFDYIAGKHETEFRFITQLTTSECSAMDVKNTINVNSVLNASKTAINTFKDDATDNTCKAEEHYVKEYYDLTNEPKMIVSVTVADDQNITKDNIYTITALPNRNFMLMSKSYDLKYNTVKIQLREI